eukprot:SAG31_NODE_1647_length_7645_cov_47.639544_12_plen_62_part_00
MVTMACPLLKILKWEPGYCLMTGIFRDRKSTWSVIALLQGVVARAIRMLVYLRTASAIYTR